MNFASYFHEDLHVRTWFYEREFHSNSEARRKNNAMEEAEIPVGEPPQLGAIIPKARPLLDSQTKERLEKSKRLAFK